MHNTSCTQLHPLVAPPLVVVEAVDVALQLVRDVNRAGRVRGDVVDALAPPLVVVEAVDVALQLVRDVNRAGRVRGDVVDALATPLVVVEAVDVAPMSRCSSSASSLKRSMSRCSSSET